MFALVREEEWANRKKKMGNWLGPIPVTLAEI